MIQITKYCRCLCYVLVGTVPDSLTSASQIWDTSCYRDGATTPKLPKSFHFIGNSQYPESDVMLTPFSRTQLWHGYDWVCPCHPEVTGPDSSHLHYVIIQHESNTNNNTTQTQRVPTSHQVTPSTRTKTDTTPFLEVKILYRDEWIGKCTCDHWSHRIVSIKYWIVKHETRNNLSKRNRVDRSCSCRLS